MDVDLPGLFRDLVRLETEVWNRLEAESIRRMVCRWRGWRSCRWSCHRAGVCRVLDIAEALSITVGGASKVVDKVEAAGLCRRQPNPTDGRSNLIQLTETGAIY